MSTSPVKSVTSQKELPHCTFFSSYPTAHCFLPNAFLSSHRGFLDMAGRAPSLLPATRREYCVNNRYEGMPNDKSLAKDNGVPTQNITITIY